MAVNLIKTRAGRKFHVANGAHIYCGVPHDGDISFVSGDVRVSDVCDRCSRGQDIRQFGIEGVRFLRSWEKVGVTVKE